MIKCTVAMAVVSSLLFGSLPARGDAMPRRDFESIASKLDPGGELFLVLQAGRWIDRGLKDLVADGHAMPPLDFGEQAANEAIERTRAFLNRSGLSAWRGIGMSTVEQTGGRHAVKLYLLRDAVDSGLPLWRGFFGWQPRRLMSLDFVPAGFSMVRAGTLEPQTLWGMLVDAVRETGGAGAQVRFDVARAALTTWLGMPPEDLLGSLRDEMLVAIRWEKETTFGVRVGSDEVTLPVPEILVLVATGEDVLRGVLEAKLAHWSIPLAESVVAGIPMRYMEKTIDNMPFALQPAYASAPGFFLIGSSPTVVEEALLAYRHRNGLVTRPGFQAAFQGIPMINNGLLYINADGARVLRHWTESQIETKRDAAQSDSAVADRLVRTFAQGGDVLPTCALVVRNWKQGVMINGYAGAGGEVALRTLGGAGLSLLNAWSNHEWVSKTER